MTVKEYFESLGETPTDIRIKVVTLAKMYKKANPYKDVMKVQSLVCQVNYDYEKIMGAEHGAWVSEERKWGKHIEGTCLITHKDEFYVSVYILKPHVPIYFTEDGTVSCLELAPYIYLSSRSLVRDINIKNILLWSTLTIS